MRVLARYDPDRYTTVAQWPLREALLAYVEHLLIEATAAYERRVDRFMHGRTLKDEPAMPPLLRAALGE